MRISSVKWLVGRNSYEIAKRRFTNITRLKFRHYCKHSVERLTITNAELIENDSLDVH